MRLVIFLRYAVLALLATACGFRDAEVVELDHSDGKIDLGVQLPGSWDRVCILMPYATSGQAEKLLGFAYSPEIHSAIAVMDDRTLLLTVAGGEVVGSFEVKRQNADFARGGARCYRRSEAVFRYQLKEGGWNEVSPTTGHPGR